MPYSLHTSPLATAASGLRFQPKFWLSQYAETMTGSLITTGTASLLATATFNLKSDLFGVSWSSQDQYSHPLLRYTTNNDYSNVIFEFTITQSSNLPGLNTSMASGLTITDLQGTPHYITLANYLVGTGTSTVSTYRIDFNNLYSGYLAYPDPSAVKVDQTQIAMISFAIAPPGFDKTNATPLTGGQIAATWALSAMTVTGGSGSTLYAGTITTPTHDVRMTTTYDTYYLTPERMTDEIVALGYHTRYNHCIVVSNVNNRTWSSSESRIVVDPTQSTLNAGFVAWHRDLFARMWNAGMWPTVSFTVEQLGTICPTNWAQEDWQGNLSATGKIYGVARVLRINDPTITAFLAQTSIDCLNLLPSGAPKWLQIGEPNWWTNVFDGGTGAPCIYDPGTTARYTAQTGNTAPIIETIIGLTELSSAENEYAAWLGQQMGEMCQTIASTVKAAVPGAKVGLLPYIPGIFDDSIQGVPVTPLLPIINFPVDYYSYPNFDFFQVEDYDWVVPNILPIHSTAYSYASTLLGFPASAIEYFPGVANFPSDWWTVNQVLDQAFAIGYSQVIVWAHLQIARDGFFYYTYPSGQNDPLPTVFDVETVALYHTQTGATAPEITSIYATPTTTQNTYINWLVNNLGNAVLTIVENARAEVSGVQAGVMPYLPSIFDGTSINAVLNWPAGYYAYPNFDFFQIDDYGWVNPVITPQHETVGTIPTALGYSSARTDYVTSIETASDFENAITVAEEGLELGYGNVSVFSYSDIAEFGLYETEAIFVRSGALFGALGLGNIYTLGIRYIDKNNNPGGILVLGNTAQLSLNLGQTVRTPTNPNPGTPPAYAPALLLTGNQLGYLAHTGVNSPSGNFGCNLYFEVTNLILGSGMGAHPNWFAGFAIYSVPTGTTFNISTATLEAVLPPNAYNGNQPTGLPQVTGEASGYSCGIMDLPAGTVYDFYGCFIDTAGDYSAASIICSSNSTPQGTLNTQTIASINTVSPTLQPGVPAGITVNPVAVGVDAYQISFDIGVNDYDTNLITDASFLQVTGDSYLHPSTTSTTWTFVEQKVGAKITPDSSIGISPPPPGSSIPYNYMSIQTPDAVPRDMCAYSEPFAITASTSLTVTCSLGTGSLSTSPDIYFGVCPSSSKTAGVITPDYVSGATYGSFHLSSSDYGNPGKTYTVTVNIPSGVAAGTLGCFYMAVRNIKGNCDFWQPSINGGLLTNTIAVEMVHSPMGANTWSAGGCTTPDRSQYQGNVTAAIFGVSTSASSDIGLRYVDGGGYRSAVTKLGTLFVSSTSYSLHLSPTESYNGKPERAPAFGVGAICYNTSPIATTGSYVFRWNGTEWVGIL